MPLTLAEAAQATGLNRSTIQRAIKSGRISGARDENCALWVVPVELHRVFPPASAKPEPVHQDAQTDALVLELRALRPRAAPEPAFPSASFQGG